MIPLLTHNLIFGIFSRNSSDSCDEWPVVTIIPFINFSTTFTASLASLTHNNHFWHHSPTTTISGITHPQPFLASLTHNNHFWHHSPTTTISDITHPQPFLASLTHNHFWHHSPTTTISGITHPQQPFLASITHNNHFFCTQYCHIFKTFPALVWPFHISKKFMIIISVLRVCRYEISYFVAEKVLYRVNSLFDINQLYKRP
jgi:hypothetical protein